MVKCWDLEANKVIRHYHGHLSGVYSLSLHPTLDVLVTAGRDASARVWDMRTKAQIHVLSGHTATVADVKCQESDPQVITGSMDSTVRWVFWSYFKFLHQRHSSTRLWDLAAGKTMVTLTHHKKSVRALAIHPTEYSFASGSAGGNNIKKWKCPEGAFVFNFSGHNAIINTMSVNAEGVFFSGGGFLSPSLLYMVFAPYIVFPFKLISFRILLRGKISQFYAHRYLCRAFWQVTTEPLHSGTTQPEHRSRTWKTFHNRVRSKQRRASSAQHSIKLVLGWLPAGLTKQSRYIFLLSSFEASLF